MAKVKPVECNGLDQIMLVQDSLGHPQRIPVRQNDMVSLCIEHPTRQGTLLSLHALVVSVTAEETFTGKVYETDRKVLDLLDLHNGNLLSGMSRKYVQSISPAPIY